MQSRHHPKALDAILYVAGVSAENRDFIISWIKENVATGSICYSPRKANFPDQFTITVSAMREISRGNTIPAVKEIRSGNSGMGLAESMVIAEYLIHMYRNHQN